jgi:hypothetical protein
MQKIDMIIINKDNRPLAVIQDWVVDYFKIAQYLDNEINIDEWLSKYTLKWKTLKEFLEFQNITVWYYNNVSGEFYQKDM